MLVVSAISGMIFAACNTALNIFYYKKTVKESLYEANTWFWRGFAIGAIIYGAIWTSYIIYLTIFSGAGFGALKYAEQYGIKTYEELRVDLYGTGLQAHHIIPERFAQFLGLNPGDMLSVAVQFPAEHPFFTNMWRQLIPYGAQNVTREQIREAATIVYQEYPALLEAARIQLMMSGG